MHLEAEVCIDMCVLQSCDVWQCHGCLSLQMECCKSFLLLLLSRAYVYLQGSMNIVNLIAVYGTLCKEQNAIFR